MAMRMLRKHKVAALLGVVFGLAAPFIALSLDRNYSPDLANLLTFPMMPFMLFGGKYLGEATGKPLWLLLTYLSSVVFWSALFVVVASICFSGRRRRRSW